MSGTSIHIPKKTLVKDLETTSHTESYTQLSFISTPKIHSSCTITIYLRSIATWLFTNIRTRLRLVYAHQKIVKTLPFKPFLLFIVCVMSFPAAICHRRQLKMAFPPTRYRDINSWLPYSSERIAPVPPTRLSDAHFYTMGPHLQLHHLDYVILQRHHQLVLSYHQEQITFWNQVHRDVGKLMHILQFYHHHMHRQNNQDGLTDFLYGTINTRAHELMRTVHQAVRYLKRHAEGHTSSQYLTTIVQSKVYCGLFGMRLSLEPQRSFSIQSS